MYIRINHLVSHPYYDLIMTKQSYLSDGRAPIPLKEITSRVMSANKALNIKPELLLRKALWDANIREYRLHWKKAPVRPDIAFVSKRIAVFVNVCYWHRCPYSDPHVPLSNKEFWSKKFQANTERDKRKTIVLKEK